MRLFFLLVLCVCSSTIHAQLASNVYHFTHKVDGKNLQHELKIDANYFVHTIYEESPAKFIKTRGGFYTLEAKQIKVKLEFNSDYKNDGVSSLTIPFKQTKKGLTLSLPEKMEFTSKQSKALDLDGKWLITGRGGVDFDKTKVMNRPRKTMKFLINGHFQWIAYNSDTFDFLGTGGGTYTAKDGVYTEHIKFFSRDNSRVGAALDFTYALKKGDWQHSGKSSKGKDIYEVWSIRF